MFFFLIHFFCVHLMYLYVCLSLSLSLDNGQQTMFSEFVRIDTKDARILVIQLHINNERIYNV